MFRDSYPEGDGPSDTFDQPPDQPEQAAADTGPSLTSGADVQSAMNNEADGEPLVGPPRQQRAALERATIHETGGEAEDKPGSDPQVHEEAEKHEGSYDTDRGQHPAEETDTDGETQDTTDGAAWGDGNDDGEDSPPKPGEYGKHEHLLGVATNRAKHRSYDRQPTHVAYYALDTDVSIDFEQDSKLVNFLERVRHAVGDEYPSMSVAQAERITQQVVAQTPEVDVDDSLHKERTTTLGAALEQPVSCIDRALAMDASLKMFGYKDAQILSSVGTDTTTGESRGHADVIFTINGEAHVAVTLGAMGQYAGSVLSEAEYAGPYLEWRRQNGRSYQISSIDPRFPETFFQTIEAT